MGGAQSESILLKIGRVAGCFKFGNEFSGSIKFGEVLELLRMLASQEGFCLTGLVCYVSKFISIKQSMWAGIAQSVQRFATGWTVRGSNAGGGEIICTRPDRSWGPHNLLDKGYLFSFPAVKRPWRGANLPPHLALRLKKEYSCTFTASPGHGGLLQDELYRYLYKEFWRYIAFLLSTYK